MSLQALHAKPTASLLLDVISQGEGAFIEFKSSFQKEVIETLSAFANTQAMQAISAPKVQAFADAIKLNAPFDPYIITGNYKSHLRNKQIATIFKELELIEKYGSGVRRVIDIFVAYGLPEPEFEATQGGMAVTVFNAANVGANSLLAYIQANPGQRAGEMAGIFAVTQRTIERWLKQNKEKGLIEFRGAAKTGGYYKKDK